MSIINRLCLLIIELETMKMTMATRVNGKFVRPAVVYWWRCSFCTTFNRVVRCTVRCTVRNVPHCTQVCAPRWKNQLHPGTLLMNGVCYALGPDLEDAAALKRLPLTQFSKC